MSAHCFILANAQLAPAETPAAVLTRKALLCRQDISPRQLKENPLGQGPGDKKAVKNDCLYIQLSYSILNMPEESCLRKICSCNT